MGNKNNVTGTLDSKNYFGKVEISVPKQQLLGILSHINIQDKDYRSNSLSEFMHTIGEEQNVYSNYQGNTRMVICKSIESQLKKILKSLEDVRKSRDVTDREGKVALLREVTLYSFFHKIIEETEEMKKYMDENKDNFDYKHVPKELGINPLSLIEAKDIADLSPDAVKILEDFLGTPGILATLPHAQKQTFASFNALRIDSAEKALKGGEFFNDDYPSYQLMKTLFLSKNPEALSSGMSDIQIFINRNYPLTKCKYAGREFQIGDEIECKHDTHGSLPVGRKGKIQAISLMIQKDKHEPKAALSYIVKIEHEGQEKSINLSYFMDK